MSYTIDKTYALGVNEGDSNLTKENLYIVAHETANPDATGANEASYMKRNWRKAYTQYVVGDGKVYLVGEPGYVAYGALDANDYSPVQIELQHNKELFSKNYPIYIELIRDSAKKYNIPLTLDEGGKGTKGVKSHLWVTENIGGNHTDPYGFLAENGISKEQFRKDIMNGIGNTSQKKENDKLAVNIEKAIDYMYSLKKRNIRYSMTGSRTGSDGSGDCSGTIYQGLRNAGMPNAGWVLNTDSMHSWLEKNGWKQIAHNKSWTAKRGDVVIFGARGASGGAAGHVVLFISSSQIIHCTYKSASANGVYVDNEATTCPYSMGWYVYRLNSSSAAKPSTSKPSTSTLSKTTFANGSKVKVRTSATKYQTGQSIPSSVKGKTYTVQQRKTVNQSKSVYAFLLKEITSWVLAQDLEAVKATKPKPSTSKPKDWSKDYFTTNPKKVELLKDDGLYGKDDVDFKKGKAGGTYKKGTQFTITGIKKRSDGLPRLITQSGFLLTANKKYVKQVGSTTGYSAKKVGQVVTVQNKATKWQTGQNIPSFVKGKKYVIEQVKSVNQSNSKRAYLLGNGLNSWILEQDVK